jgi:hypothetical protein
MTALLLSHPHNYSAALEHLDRPIAPRGVKRAIDYIESHLERLSMSVVLSASSSNVGT